MDIIEEQSIQDSNIEFFKKHFPQVLELDPEDGKYIINTEKLQLAIDPSKAKIEENGYELKWVGKKEAYHKAYIKNDKLLKPLYDDSKNFADTGNILIKGDNLDALKLLRKNYQEKIKMIYIDPPYNTKSDEFVYNDNFTQSKQQTLDGLNYDAKYEEYIENIYGARTHSGWLSFMYPRLLLAKDLLTDDGVIFISIDDNEQAQLKILCDEVFGQENFVGQFIWETKRAARGVPPINMLMHTHEYTLAYCKSDFKFKGETRKEEDFSNPDNDTRGLWRSESMKATGSQNNSFVITNPKNGMEFHFNWAFSESKIKQMLAENLILFPDNKDGTPRQKKFINSYRNEKKAIISHLGWFSTENATKKFMDLFNGRKIFGFPKPVDLLTFLLINLLIQTTSS